MEAIVLAGGEGTRLRPLTYARPKPLLPLANRALIDRVVEAIPDRFDTVIVPVHHHADLMRAHFAGHPDDRVVLVDEPAPLGSGGAIQNCASRITGPFLVVNADIASSVNLERLWRGHYSGGRLASISLWSVEDPTHFGVARLGLGERIVEFVEKPPRGAEASSLVNAGHYLLDPDVLDEIPRGRPSSLEREVFTKLASRNAAIYGHRFDGFWVDAGRPETYLEAHRALLGHENRRRALGEDVVGLESATFESYALGNGVRLGSGATVRRSVALPFAEIGARAEIVDSILGEGVRIGEAARLERCVVADRATVPAGARLEDQRIGPVDPVGAPAVATMAGG